MNMFQQGYEMVAQGVNQVVTAVFIDTCIEILGKQKGLVIKQKFELFEALSGCETPNVYKVFAATEQGEKIKGKALFKCKEKSSTMARICCPGALRPFEMKVANYGCKDFQSGIAKSLLKDDKRLVFRLKREYQCTCLCFNRPKLTINYVEGKENKKLGTIVNPWMWCNKACDIYDENDIFKYRVEASCNQLYFWCACPCDSCNKVSFEIKLPTGAVVGFMKKKGKGCVKNMMGDADNFKLIFPEQASAVDKALLMACVLMIDYMYFEDDSSQSNQVGVA